MDGLLIITRGILLAINFVVGAAYALMIAVMTLLLPFGLI